MVFAEKFPLPSRRTMAEAVLLDEADVALLATFPAEVMVLSFVSSMEPASIALVTFPSPMTVAFCLPDTSPDSEPVKSVATGGCHAARPALSDMRTLPAAAPPESWMEAAWTDVKRPVLGVVAPMAPGDAQPAAES